MFLLGLITQERKKRGNQLIRVVGSRPTVVAGKKIFYGLRKLCMDNKIFL